MPDMSSAAPAPPPDPAPVVLVHGLIGTLQDPEIFQALRAALGGRPVLAPDRFGYGHLRAVDPALVALEHQVARLRGIVAEGFDRPVALVGHSVGGVVAALFAHRYPALVEVLVSVEGNFTLRDAFWSTSVARMAADEVEALLQGWRADPAAWLARSGIAPTAAALALARAQLDRQPASTVHATAQSVVAVTGAPAYETALREVFGRVPVHLVAGERSRAGWDVPDWALAAAASHTVLPDRGHLMMLEDAAGFGAAVGRALAAR